MSGESENEFDDSLPVSMLVKAREISEKSIPDKSVIKYRKEYDKFKNWLTSNKTSCLKEVFMVYLQELSTKLSSATLWAKYSMLKKTILAYDNLDISSYKKVSKFLKDCHKNHVPKQALVFTSEEITRFCNDAPDSQYLDIKAIVTMAVCGGLRTCESTNMKFSNVTDRDGVLLVKVPKFKTNCQRSFVIENEFYDICKKYMALRPPNTEHNRFFLNYKMAKCTTQPIGRNTMSKMPQVIARFLDLPNPTLYTGHSFRRTSATLLVDGGADILALKRHGGWNSDRVAQRYLDDSVANKKQASAMITKTLNIVTSTSGSVSTSTFVPLPSSSRKRNNDVSVQSVASAPCTITSSSSRQENKNLIRPCKKPKISDTNVTDVVSDLHTSDTQNNEENYDIPEELFFDNFDVSSNSVKKNENLTSVIAQSNLKPNEVIDVPDNFFDDEMEPLIRNSKNNKQALYFKNCNINIKFN